MQNLCTENWNYLPQMGSLKIKADPKQQNNCIRPDSNCPEKVLDPSLSKRAVGEEETVLRA